MVAICEHCAARRSTGDEDVQKELTKEDEAEIRILWGLDPTGMSATCSYLSPAESWSSAIHESGVRSVHDYYKNAISFLFRRDS